MAKKEKKKRRRSSIQKLIGFETFTKYGVKTDKSEFVFYHVEPTNISVLSPDAVESKVYHLMALLSLEPDLELIATDSCECFDSNKAYVRKRLAEEKNEAVRKLLYADLEFLDSIQVEMSTAREFMFCVRFRREKEEQVFDLVNRVSKVISDHGFMSHRMTKPEIKRMLALYFGSGMYGDEIPDIEGENYIETESEINGIV